MNPLKDLEGLSQSVWLDGLSRHLLASGKMEQLIDQYRVSGIISKFGSMQPELTEGAYDRSIAAIVERSPETDRAELLEKLSIEDVARASDLFRPIYERSQGRDGLISLDLNPHLAYDAGQSVHRARRLWTTLARENVLIKIPATAEGIAAIEQLTAEGIPVNATLVFTLSQYEAAVEAYLRGRQRSRRQVTSVASFPVSELDCAVDRALEELGTEEALSLKGKAAIAVAALTYLYFRQIFDGPRSPGSAPSGAVRPVWVIATCAGEAYAEAGYVEALTGRESASAMSLQALEASAGHGRAEAGLDTARSRAGETLGTMFRLGINAKSVGQELTGEAVETLRRSYDNLLRAVEERRAALGPERAA